MTGPWPDDVDPVELGKILAAIYAPHLSGGPPFTHTLKLPESEEEMRAEPGYCYRVTPVGPAAEPVTSITFEPVPGGFSLAGYRPRSWWARAKLRAWRYWAEFRELMS